MNRMLPLAHPARHGARCPGSVRDRSVEEKRERISGQARAVAIPAARGRSTTRAERRQLAALRHALGATLEQRRGGTGREGCAAEKLVTDADAPPADGTSG